MRLCDSDQGNLPAEHAEQAAVLHEPTIERSGAGRAASVQPAACGSISHTSRPGMLVHITNVLQSNFLATHVKLDKLLGSGGFSRVYAGSAFSSPYQGSAASSYQSNGTESDRRVAVKVFDVIRSGVSPAMLQQMAAKELEALHLLQHEAYVATILAAGQLSNEPAGADVESVSHVDDCKVPSIMPCLVLELVPNTVDRSLEYVTQFSEAEAKLITRQLAQQLKAMHSGQLGGVVILHGDVKPNNVLLRFDGSVALSDFGACHMFGVADNNAAAAAGGYQVDVDCLFASPYYAAPELYHRAKAVGKGVTDNGSSMGGEHQRSDSQTGATLNHNNKVLIDNSWDVFGLGVLVVRMLAGPLHSLFVHEPKSAQGADAWEKVLTAIVNRQFCLPENVQLSDSALQFVGCACGVGSTGDVAVGQCSRKRFSAAQLLEHPWLRS